MNASRRPKGALSTDRGLLSARRYHEGGSLREIRHDEDGKLQRLASFHENGAPAKRHEVDARGRVVYAASWDDEGAVQREVRSTWDQTRLVSFVERDRTGVVCEAARRGEALACRLFRRGRLAAEGSVARGRLVGRWRTFMASSPAASALVRSDVDMSEITSKTLFEEAPDGARLHAEAMEGFARHLTPKVSTAELSELDAIKWHRLGIAFGDAKRFPLYLRALASPDPFIHPLGLDGLTNDIERQSSVYAATVAVLPFLIRLVADEHAPRTCILSLIHLATKAAASFRETSEKSEQARAAIGTLAALRDGMPILIGRMETVTPSERLLIVELAGHAQSRPDVRMKLVQWARSATEPALRAVAVHAVARSRDRNIAVLAPALADTDALVRTVGAISIGQSFGEASPRLTMVRLREAFDNRASLQPRFAALPFVGEHLLPSLSLAIGAIRSPDAFAMADALIDALDTVASTTAYGEGLLELAFGKRRRPFMPGFLDVLEALAKSRSFYAVHGDAASTLARFGLPSALEPDELLAFVEEARSAPDPEAKVHDYMRGVPRRPASVPPDAIWTADRWIAQTREERGPVRTWAQDGFAIDRP